MKVHADAAMIRIRRILGCWIRIRIKVEAGSGSAIRDGKKFGSVIRDGKIPESGINIPDPQHWLKRTVYGLRFMCVRVRGAGHLWQQCGRIFFVNLKPVLRIRIRDEQPGSYFREFRNHSFRAKILKFFDADPGDQGWKKIRIWDPGWKIRDPG
jgi:hypothetical protein